MKNGRKLLLSAIVILLIIIVAIIITMVVLNKNKDKNQLENEQQRYLNTIENPGQIIDGLKPEELKAESVYYTIDDCIKEFISRLEKNDSTAIYNLLNKQYVNNNNISINNAITKLSIKKYKDYESKKIYGITGKTYSTYYVSAKANNSDVFFIVNTDNSSKSFDIQPSTKEEFETKRNTVISSTNKYENTIESNENNTINYNYYQEEDIVQKYFQNYLELALKNPEEAYELLDSKYKTAKFSNVKDFEKYITNRKKKIESMCKASWKKYTDFSDYKDYEDYYRQVSKNGLEKYTVKQKSDGRQYICIDNYGNYYIFDIKAAMDYTIMLDIYTVDLPEFTEKYKNGTNQEKVALNIQKVVQALNNEDYEYVYGKLADSFKQKYFTSFEKFEKYAKNTFGEGMELNFGEFSEGNNVYTYSISLKAENKTISKTIIMKIVNNTDFTMSFNVD